MILQLHKKIVLWAYLLFFSMFLVSCSKSYEIENQYVTATVPYAYQDLTDFVQNDVLYLDSYKLNGLESIFAIDNIQDLLIQPNSQTILEDTPVEVLARRLRSIERESHEPDFPWKNFKILEEPKATTFKGRPAAEATFDVVEYVNRIDDTISKRVKRLVIFVDDDLWNIVLAPSESKYYKDEMEIFETILESLEIKKYDSKN
ncbi:hypothetical protein HX004_02010 [Myroides sp. 1354]|uniref:hypothetical protein n=1 Tax=unclassified Myroides TaxID=2642485 RepID=UPI002577B8E2|nr:MULTISPECIES: hypothetical protein [unclassified Myroides]MDM1043386.1 hypothetical protein [Myroides sp. R163-1]MDM1054563.1 hypothetical protein [Myroides sp. 1354]MDM1067860.1 hypothetical protein [Myroides sp. 1372]